MSSPWTSVLIERSVAPAERVYICQEQPITVGYWPVRRSH